jgi:hypothetical protein
MKKKFYNTSKSKSKVNPGATLNVTLAQQIAAKLQQGFLLHNAGQLEKANIIYEEILMINPKQFDALQLSGMLAAQQGQLQKAFTLLNSALIINNNNAFVYNNFGNVLKELKRLEEALSSFNRAIKLKPDYVEAYSNRGNVLYDLKRLDEAVRSYDKAIDLQPDYAEIYISRGNVLSDLNRLQEALANYNKAIKLKPKYAQANFNRGNVLHKLQQLEQALASYDNAIDLKPDYAQAYLNRGNVLNDLNRLDEALASYDNALELKPDYAEAYSSRGNVLHEIDRLKDALASYDKAIEFSPEYARAHHGKSFILLLTGKFHSGFQELEWRRLNELSALYSDRERFTQPLWLGNASLANKSILLHSEQGLGDCLQMCRYAKLVKNMGARVLLEVPKPLIALLESLDGVDALIEKGMSPIDFDFQCPLMSLPLAFKTDLASIPNAQPYLKSNSEKLELWRQRLGYSSKPRIGLVWTGNKNHRHDHKRSIELASMLRILPKDFEYVSLQKEVREVDKPALAEGHVRHFGELLEDFSDTAALCDLMDLVISVDTSVAHLAGAIGKTTWILLSYIPDWRWLLHRDDSPWYGSVKLYRQGEDRQYAPVLERVAKSMRELQEI